MVATHGEREEPLAYRIGNPELDELGPILQEVSPSALERGARSVFGLEPQFERPHANNDFFLNYRSRSDLAAYGQWIARWLPLWIERFLADGPTE